jgi:propionyl-CoA carboxylase alpha chain
MFKKILIANRGEIACRVIKSARLMGIKTVAVYSEADHDALHVKMADEAVCIGPGASSESYLLVDNVLAAINLTGADAVHPGYGFLSENASFARKLKRQGVAFIGPNVNAITKMGDKIESKKLAEKAGVNTVPGYTEALKDVKHALAASKKIGYPVMLKASAGGGGKGMRVAFNENEVREGFVSAKREAASSFTDDRMFVEKFIEEPRHIEIQIMADSHGNTIYLGERECSIQRRHQKIVEESPSPFIDEKTRKSMGDQAVLLSKAVKYVSAGTVEFIVDAKRNFYFLEMNTRLQVEHPVTEKITGLDLVELMIRIAAGEKLPLIQEDVILKGWAIETRIYAEDPRRGFLPSVGRLVRYRAPKESEHVRVDSGVYEGCEISIYYDPMISKLITYGADREEAIAHMRHALDGYFIRGVSHNISFLSALMAHPRFQMGNLTTHFIVDEYPDGFDPSCVPHDDPELLVCVSACVHRAYQERAACISGQYEGHHRKVLDDWIVILGGKKKKYALNIVCVAGGYDLQIGDARVQIRTDWKFGEPLFEAQLNGSLICLQVKRNGAGYTLFHSGFRVDVMVLNPHIAELYALMPEKIEADTSKFLLSPMPGLLISINVKEGEKIKGGQELAVVEAMKMENVFHAERDGIVKSIKAVKGDSLSVNQLILEFE